MNLREAAQQALEALELHLQWHESGCVYLEPAVTTLRAALAEPVQEPVAWMVYTLDGKSVCVTDNPSDFTEQHKALPLYTAPPQRKPLTDADIEAVSDSLPIDDMSMPTTWHLRLARAIERAHGIGGEE